MNRDTRFSKDKTPYKDHLDFWFWEGERRRALSGFYMRITPTQLGIGVGAHGFDTEGLAAFRAAVIDTKAGPERRCRVRREGGLAGQGREVQTATPGLRCIERLAGPPPQIRRPVVWRRCPDPCIVAQSRSRPLRDESLDEAQSLAPLARRHAAVGGPPARPVVPGLSLRCRRPTRRLLLPSRRDHSWPTGRPARTDRPCRTRTRRRRSCPRPL